MKRILFVDDEPMVLEGLRRTLASQAGHWDMAFAPGGEEALTMMDAAPFDVVVSDIRMPGMDGAELLKSVCQRHPTTVRIVLSSQAEMEGALRAVPVAHQFLLKPCDPAMLRVAIERATSLSNVLSNKLLESIVGSVKDLPVLPRTYLALRQAVADPQVSMKEVVKIVEQDVAVSAKVLQLVNSAFFGLPREVSTVRTAVTFLGIDMVQGSVLSSEVSHVFAKANEIPGFTFEEVHAHSQLVAKIAGRMEASAHVHSAAIVAGMLHDVGKLLLAVRSPKHFARAVAGAREEDRPLYSVEQELMGVSHAEVGAYLLGLWGLPTPVVEAVAHHHHPDRVPHDSVDSIAMVHIANFLAHEHPVRPAGERTCAYLPVDPAYLETVGVTEQMEDWGEMAEASAEELRALEKATR